MKVIKLLLGFAEKCSELHDEPYSKVFQVTEEYADAIMRAIRAKEERETKKKRR